MRACAKDTRLNKSDKVLPKQPERLRRTYSIVDNLQARERDKSSEHAILKHGEFRLIDMPVKVNKALHQE